MATCVVCGEPVEPGSDHELAALAAIAAAAAFVSDFAKAHRDGAPEEDPDDPR